MTITEVYWLIIGTWSRDGRGMICRRNRHRTGIECRGNGRRKKNKQRGAKDPRTKRRKTRDNIPDKTKKNAGYIPDKTKKNMKEGNIVKTQDIHERVNHRCGRNISLKHLAILMECFGQPITEANIEAFLKYAWQ